MIPSAIAVTMWEVVTHPGNWSRTADRCTWIDVSNADPFGSSHEVTMKQVNDCLAYHTHCRRLAIPPRIVLSSGGSRPIPGVNLLHPLRPTIYSTSIQILTALIDSYKQVHKPLGNRESCHLIQYTVISQ
jgi:hypothetical protein